MSLLFRNAPLRNPPLGDLNRALSLLGLALVYRSGTLCTVF